MTNRFGFHSSSHPVSLNLDGEDDLGSSDPPFDRLNLGLKVGDDRQRVLRNREQVTKGCGVDRIIFMDQIHSNLMIDAARGGEAQCDGIYQPRAEADIRHALAVQVADCVPLILEHPKVIAAVHVGREGLVKGMTEAAIEGLRPLAQPFEIKATIGPSICGDCYPLSAETFDECAMRYPASVYDARDRKVDVATGVISTLEDLGIAWQWFGGERECVACDKEYFSYRRDGVTGRQAMVVGW